ncbi:MAG TPA: BMC domain-containing protein [Polyangia bacterium]
MQGPFHRREGQGAEVAGPALGVVELGSVARGIVVADAMVKKAPVELVFARAVSSGKFVVLVSGAVADVEEASACAIETAQAALVDRLLLPQAADGVLAALRRHAPAVGAADAVGIFETFSVASTLNAADAAAKAAAVEVAELRLADGLGGKAYFIVAGPQADVEAALFAAEHVTATGMLLARELIPRPHEDLLKHLR